MAKRPKVKQQLDIIDVEDRAEGVQIQVKGKSGGPSKSMTVHNMQVDDVFNRIFFTFEAIEKAGGNDVKIVHHKIKNE